ncbi:MFS transporter [Pseudoduganella ginsengisoli]|uniref:MFS transporter n=1 Tax=Pseudoduganella ginsengisoli TaxID=1462440 RepID=A0A6L6Q4P4_9BURK|nr:MFS transporter [Pseudoduganella ginsengisoli]MTW04092.1 MFS transporter [Pseudoduganella ginsengisoli]
MKSSLLANSIFVRLWAAHTLSEMGAKVSLLAFPLIAAVTLQATPEQMGRLVAAETLPYLLLGLLAGGWVDRLQKRLVLVSANAARASLLLAVPLLAWRQWLSIEALYGVAFLIGTAEVWFNIASAAYTPLVVGKESLVDAYSKLAVSTSSAEAAGPMVAGALIQWLGPTVAVLANALTYMGSSIFIGSQRHHDDVGHAADRGGRPPMRQEILSGLRFVFTHRILRAITLRLGAWQFVVGVIQALLVYYALNQLQLPAGSLGLIFSAMGVGILAGALSVKALAQRLGTGNSIIFAVIVAALSAYLIPLASGSQPMRCLSLCCAMFMYGICTTVYEVNNVSLRQSLTPLHMLGRMTATVRVATLGIRPLGALVGGWCGGTIGIKPTLLVVITMGLLLSLSSLLASPLRHLDGLAPAEDIH